jgi:protein-tyrosine kinase
MVTNANVDPEADARGEDTLVRLLSASGKISESDVERILDYARMKGVNFGEAAVQLRLIEREDLDQALAAPFDFSSVADAPGSVGRELIAVNDPFSRKAEALRSLRVQLMLGSFAPTANTLAIVSPSSGDGRSFIAANLAIVFSQLGERTLLVDAHLQKSRLHEMFGTQNGPGLSSALMGRSSSALKAIAVPQLKNLWLVPAGERPRNADDILARNTLIKVCSALKSQYDVVVFDTPPGDSSTGADWIANRCGKALMVVRQGHTGFAASKAFLERIKARAEMVGCVLNKY